MQASRGVNRTKLRGYAPKFDSAAASQAAEERRARNGARSFDIHLNQTLPRFLLVRVELQYPEIVSPCAPWRLHVFE